MNLLLSGGGSEEKSRLLDKKFSELIDKSKPLLYIPIAIDTIKHPYPNCLAWLKNCLKPFGITNVVMWTEKELAIAKESEFSNFSGVYIGGGNTFKLLKELKELKALQIISSLAKKGLPVYGGSAGAIIFGKTILTASLADKNEVELKEFNALNLVSGYEIWPHYTEKEKEIVKEYQTKHNSKVIAIPEDSGAYITKDKIQVIGYSPVTMFYKNGTELKFNQDNIQ